MLTFACSCGKELRTPDEFAGRQTRCPSCGSAVTVPSAAIQSAPSPAAPAPQGPGEELPALSPNLAAPATTSRMAIASLVFGILSFCLPVLAGIPAFILAIRSLTAIKRSGGRLSGTGLAIAGLVTATLGTVMIIPCAGMVAGFLTAAVEKSRDAGRRAESLNNLHKIGIGMINYHDTMGGFPTADKNGLSWRVQMMLFTGEQDAMDLYSQFKMDEPWDSPNNIKLLPLMPKVYRCPRFPAADPGMTYYRGFVGPGTVLGTGGEPANLSALANGKHAGNTIMIVEAGDPVPWTKPDELPFDPNQPLPAFGGPQRKSFCALFADGHVQTIQPTADPATLKLMIDWTNTQPFKPLP